MPLRYEKGNETGGLSCISFSSSYNVHAMNAVKEEMEMPQPVCKKNTMLVLVLKQHLSKSFHDDLALIKKYVVLTLMFSSNFLDKSTDD